MQLSPLLQTFLERSLPVFRADKRILGVLVAGSAVTALTDQFSDLDLAIVCADEDYSTVVTSKQELAATLGTLLSAFTGEHVGEPQLLICLFDQPLLHVDLKFIRIADLSSRVETPLVAFDRDGTVAQALEHGSAEWPLRSAEWFEERAWIWLHYTATKIGRGELFEAHDALAYFRAQVLGMMLARNQGRRQRGVRSIEFESPEKQKS